MYFLSGQAARVLRYRFVMQCWTRDELDSYLTRSGFVAPTYFGAYAVDIAAGTTDRLVAVSQRA